MARHKTTVLANSTVMRIKANHTKVTEGEQFSIGRARKSGGNGLFFGECTAQKWNRFRGRTIYHSKLWSSKVVVIVDIEKTKRKQCSSYLLLLRVYSSIVVSVCMVPHGGVIVCVRDTHCVCVPDTFAFASKISTKRPRSTYSWVWVCSSYAQWVLQLAKTINNQRHLAKLIYAAAFVTFATHRNAVRCVFFFNSAIRMSHTSICPCKRSSSCIDNKAGQSERTSGRKKRQTPKEMMTVKASRV